MLCSTSSPGPSTSMAIPVTSSSSTVIPFASRGLDPQLDVPAIACPLRLPSAAASSRAPASAAPAPSNKIFLPDMAFLLILNADHPDAARHDVDHGDLLGLNFENRGSRPPGLLLLRARRNGSLRFRAPLPLSPGSGMIANLRLRSSGSFPGSSPSGSRTRISRPVTSNSPTVDPFGSRRRIDLQPDKPDHPGQRAACHGQKRQDRQAAEQP